MRLKSFLTAVLGLMLAIGSVFAAQKYVNTPSSLAVSEDPGLAQVVVAREEISFGEAIGPEMVTTITWPKESVPEGAFTTLPDLLGVDGNKDPRRATRAMVQGELVLASKVSEFGEKVTIVQTLGANMRAVAIKVNATTGVGGFVTPGDQVDVLLTQGTGANIRTVTILQNINVLGIDQMSDEDVANPSIARTITVEVTPDDGQKLVLAQAAGTLSLSLRTPDSDKSQPLEQVRLSDIIHERLPMPEKERHPLVRINRGGEVTEVEVIR